MKTFTLPEAYIKHYNEWDNTLSYMIMHNEGKSMFQVYQYDDDDKTIYLSDVSVSPAYRKKGYGNAILAIVDDIATQVGANKIMLWVEKKSWMYEWYTSKGYKQVKLYKYKCRKGFTWMCKSSLFLKDS